MAVVREFALPDLGEGLTEALVVQWLVQVGDVVAIDQPVVEVETAKAMVDVPCPYGGVVTARYGEEGTDVPVGAPLLTVAVGAAEEPDADAAAPSRSDGGREGRESAARSADSTGNSGASEVSGQVLVGYGTSPPGARRRRVRPDVTSASAVGPGTAPASGASDRPSARPSQAATSRQAPAPVRARHGDDETRRDEESARQRGSVPGRARSTVGTDLDDGPIPVISPLVRRLAREYGLDLRDLTGTGPDGLIQRVDVERAARVTAASRVTPSKATAPLAGEAASAVSPLGVDHPAERRGEAAVRSAVTDGAGGDERVPLRGARGAVAEKLSRSNREIPDATCWVDADATGLLAARTAMNGAGRVTVSLLAVLARICTAALARFPELNSTVDMRTREIVRLRDVHLGIAAHTDRGLVVPVVRDAHTRHVESLSAEIARLTDEARGGKLAPAELTGGTFTLNNYGVFGVDGSTPLLNHPEAAMLGVGRIAPKPWVHEGELAVRQVVQLSLTFDHRVCDGGTAGGFLRYVADCVESPALLLRTL